jgi:hypothetical protein
MECQVYYCMLLRTMLYCTVYHCTVLYCTALYCTVLYCTVLYCTILYCAILYCTALYCTKLLCIAPYYVIPSVPCTDVLLGARQEDKESDSGAALGRDGPLPPLNTGHAPSSSVQVANNVLGDMDLDEFMRWVDSVVVDTSECALLLRFIVLCDLEIFID